MYLVRFQGVQAADGVQGLVERCCYPIRLPTVPRFKWNDRVVWTWDGWTLLDKKTIYIYLQWYDIYLSDIYIYIHICPYDMIYVRCIHVICIQSCIVYRHLNHTWHIMFVQGIAINKKACDSSQRVQFWTVWTGNECFLKVDRGIFSQSSSPTVWD